MSLRPAQACANSAGRTLARKKSGVIIWEQTEQPPQIVGIHVLSQLWLVERLQKPDPSLQKFLHNVIRSVEVSKWSVDHIHCLPCANDGPSTLSQSNVSNLLYRRLESIREGRIPVKSHIHHFVLELLGVWRHACLSAFSIEPALTPLRKHPREIPLRRQLRTSTEQPHHPSPLIVSSNSRCSSLGWHISAKVDHASVAHDLPVRLDHRRRRPRRTSPIRNSHGPSARPSH
jgi:hypothetical protein